jgi:hypothetical protein
MDRLVVMESGRIVQEGTYDELAARPGLFAALVARDTGVLSAGGARLHAAEGQRDLIQSLSLSPVFSEVDSASLAKLIAHGSTRTCASGEFLLRKGDAGDEMFVVKSGEIEIVGRLHGRGYAFGEIALFSGLRRTADVRVVKDAEFIVLPREAVLEVCRNNPETALRILRAMARIATADGNGSARQTPSHGASTPHP